MKILFLDIDGVLNHRGGPVENGIYIIDPSLLPLLKHIVNETDCKIVLSSTWRILKENRVKVQRSLRSIGTEFIDVTPRGMGVPRSDEIRTWLQDHPETKDFAILDDDPGACIEGHYFRTSWDTGLTIEIANNVIGYFNAGT